MTVWDKRFIELATLVGSWTNCARPERRIGAVVARGDEILGMGYNKVPSPLKSCLDKGVCYRKENGIESGTHQELCYSICAEQNAITEALRHYGDLTGATIYISHTPCAICARWIIEVGIKRIVYHTPYTDKFALNLLKEAGIVLEQV